MRRILLVVVCMLGCTGTASAEVVAHGIRQGMLAPTPTGRPVVAYVRGNALAIASRVRRGRWHTARVSRVPARSPVVALAAGSAGPVALLERPDGRRLLLVRRTVAGWRKIRLTGRLAPAVSLGYPGLSLDRRGLPAVAYTRWNSETRKSTLLLARVDVRGRVHTQQITSLGFPKSHVAPPAAPVFKNGALHVIESYGFEGAFGTIEWRRVGRVWSGQFLDAGVGDFPVGPLLAAVAPSGAVYVAWTQALLGTGEFPVSVTVHREWIDTNVVLDRALTAALAATAAGVTVAANEWVSADEVGLSGDAIDWAGAIASGGRRAELDGWLAGFACRRGACGVLMARPTGLAWFRSPARPSVAVTIEAADQPDGSVLVGGRVHRAAGGTVTIYRERPGTARVAAATVPLASDGSFSVTDVPPLRPLLYRAVYTDSRSGIPYAALLREPIN